MIIIPVHWSPKDHHLHLIVKAVVKNEIVSHSDAVRLHRMARPIVVTAQLWVVEIRNLQGSQCSM